MMPFLIALVLGQDALDADVRKYLDDPAARAGLVDRIAKRPPSDIEASIRRSRVYEKKESGVISAKVANSFDPKVEVAYEVFVPEYDPAQRYPLMVAMHGQSGDGPDRMGYWTGTVKAEKGLFVVSPSAKKGAWGRSRVGYGNVLGPLLDVIAKYPIDLNRVYIEGASMGGHGSFQLACAHPDLFAALSPRIGGPEFYRKTEKGDVVARSVENLKNIPLYWIVGDKDKDTPIEWIRIAKKRMDELKIEMTYVEKDGGHEAFPDEDDNVLKFLREKKRDPYPKAVHWVTHDKVFNRAYWLELSKFAKSANETWVRKFVTDKKEPLETRTSCYEQVEAVGEIDRAANSIKVTTTHVDEVKLYVNGTMLDLDKEISVTVNGKASKHKPKRDAKVLLESAVRDREMLFSAVLTLSVK